MTLLRNHIVLMLIYAVATALFFALLWRTERRDQIRFVLIVVLSLVVGGIALAWTMFPFPLK